MSIHTRKGKISTYGWSADRIDAVKTFQTSDYWGVMEQQLIIFGGDLELLAPCNKRNLANINRGPLGMAILTVKIHREIKLQG